LGCDKSENNTTFIYEYFNQNNDSSYNYFDTLIVSNDNTTKIGKFIKANQKLSFRFKETANGIYLVKNDDATKLYSFNDHSLQKNNSIKNVNWYCPFLFKDAKLDSLKEYLINNRKYKVFRYSSKNNFAHKIYSYYSPIYGFLSLVTEGNEYKRLIEVKSNKGINSNALQLTNTLINDSTFFIPKINISKTKIYYNE
jgi:hypothetical protein